MVISHHREFLTSSEEETYRIGYELARELDVGSVVSLTGALGAGKSVFVRGICGYFCPEITISSPSFTLINIYPGDKCDICHIDFYRISDEKEIEELGIDEFLNGDFVTLVEWGEKIEKHLVPGAIKVRIEIIGDSLREIAITQ